MKTVRQNVFETNSSSMHAISLPAKKLDIKEFPSFISFKLSKNDEFERGETDVLTSAPAKAMYFWTSIWSAFPDENSSESVYSDSELFDMTYERDNVRMLSFKKTKALIERYLKKYHIACDFEPLDTKDVTPINHNSVLRGHWIWKVLKTPEDFINYLFNRNERVYVYDDCCWDKWYGKDGSEIEEELKKDDQYHLIGNPSRNLMEDADDEDVDDECYKTLKKKASDDFINEYHYFKKLGKKIKVPKEKKPSLLLRLVLALEGIEKALEAQNKRSEFDDED